MGGIALRQLTPRERELAFRAKSGTVDLTPYVEAVREMEGGVAYAIPVNGTTARAMRVHFGRAAKILDLSLRWAKVPKDAKEIIVELAE